MEFLNDFLAWAWARHHNILSWYVRPLFILPFCYFAYRRNVKGLLVTLLLFPTSLFWFSAPANPSPQVLAYLDWERQFVTAGDPLARIVLLVMVIVFFVLLGAAFWKRSWLWGLAVLNIATLLKVAWSVAFGGETGWAALLPATVTLVICDSLFLLARHWQSRRRVSQPAA